MADRVVSSRHLRRESKNPSAASAMADMGRRMGAATLERSATTDASGERLRDPAAGYGRVLVLSPFGGRTGTPPGWGMDLSTQVDELRAGGSVVETVFPD